MEQQMIKAKQVKKFGIKFRSTLESKWAAFFYRAGIDFVYEPEVLSKNGISYAPDFYLPKFDMYIEIKPTTPSEKEIEKANVCDKPIVFFCSYPKCDFPSTGETGYYNSWICFTNGFIDGFHDLLTGDHAQHFKTHSLFIREDTGGKTMTLIDYLIAHTCSEYENERAIRTKLVKSDNEEDKLMTVVLHAIRALAIKFSN